MQDAGIDVTLFVVLGGRQDSIDSFKRTLELSERLQAGIHPVLLTPLPGTELYDEYREHLLPGLGWEAFTGVRAVFEHPSPDMTPLRREEEYHRLSNELFRFERIVSRVGKISSSGFPATHLYSFMMQLPMKHALSKAYEEWKAASGGAIAEAVTTAPADVAESISVPGMFFGRWNWLWLACIVTITVVDVVKGAGFGLSPGLSRLEMLLFLGSLAVVPVGLHANRKTLYKYVDILIDWTCDSRSRKMLMLRLSIIAALYIGGWYWGYTCVFRH